MFVEFASLTFRRRHSALPLTVCVPTHPPSSFLAPGIPAIIHGLFPPNAIWQSEVGAPKKKEAKKGEARSLSLSPFQRSVTFVRTTKKREGIFIYWNRKHVRSYIWGMIFRVDQNFCKFCLAACKRRGEDSILPC